jgi:hypothetical protein
MNILPPELIYHIFDFLTDNEKDDAYDNIPELRDKHYSITKISNVDKYNTKNFENLFLDITHTFDNINLISVKKLLISEECNVSDFSNFINLNEIIFRKYIDDSIILNSNLKRLKINYPIKLYHMNKLTYLDIFCSNTQNLIFPLSLKILKVRNCNSEYNIPQLNLDELDFTGKWNNAILPITLKKINMGENKILNMNTPILKDLITYDINYYPISLIKLEIYGEFKNLNNNILLRNLYVFDCYLSDISFLINLEIFECVDECRVNKFPLSLKELNCKMDRETNVNELKLKSLKGYKCNETNLNNSIERLSVYLLDSNIKNFSELKNLKELNFMRTTYEIPEGILKLEILFHTSFKYPMSLRYLNLQNVNGDVSIKHLENLIEFSVISAYGTPNILLPKNLTHINLNNVVSDNLYSLRKVKNLDLRYSYNIPICVEYLSIEIDRDVDFSKLVNLKSITIIYDSFTTEHPYVKLPKNLKRLKYEYGLRYNKEDFIIPIDDCI